LKNVKWISGRPNEIGSKWEMMIEQDGNSYVMTEELIAFKENELFVVKMENEYLTNDMEVRFIDKGAATEIFSSSRVTGKNIFLKSLFVFSRYTFTNRDREMYAQLKEAIDASN
jgi:hypothetical protein